MVRLFIKFFPLSEESDTLDRFYMLITPFLRDKE